MPAVAADSILERFRATLDTVYGDWFGKVEQPKAKRAIASMQDQARG